MFLSRAHSANLCRFRRTSFIAIDQLFPEETRAISGLSSQRKQCQSTRFSNEKPNASSFPTSDLSFPSFLSAPSLLSSSLSSSSSPCMISMSDQISFRGFHSSAASLKGVKSPVMDMRDTDIDINPDEIEYVGRKLRKFQMDTTGRSDPLPSEVEPSPLHLITLTRPYGGNSWWLKKILWEFGMYRHRKQTHKYPEYQKAIVPNTPENNQKLAKIKHCIRIDRVTFPYGYPETEEDLKHMRISEHGEVTFVKNIESHVLDDGTVATVPLGVPRESLPEEMDEQTIKVDCFRKLINSEFLEEYHHEYDNRHLGQGRFPGMKVHWKKDKPPVVY